jgi:hypothetical protein
MKKVMRARIWREVENMIEKINKDDFSKIEDISERKKAIFGSYFKVKKFNPLYFAFFVYLQYFTSFLFESVIYNLIKGFGFEVSKFVAISILIIGIVPVIISTWIELIKTGKSLCIKWILNVIFTIVVFILYALSRHLSIKFIYYALIIIVSTNILIGLLKIDYEDTKIREKLMFFHLPILIYFLMGVLVTIYMMGLTFFKFIN